MKPFLFLDLLLRRGQHLGEDLLQPRQAVRLLLRATFWLFALAAIYGLAMGSYNGLLGQSWFYAMASATKLPLLLLGTTLLCYPALYVFGIAGGAQIRPSQLLAALLCAQTMLVLALVALVPVVLFFSTTIKGYRAVKLMHVAVFVIAGISSLRFLHGLVRRADPKLSANRKLILAWMLLFGLTGAQMGWMMRPFIGSEGEQFVLTRDLRGSIFQDVPKTIRAMLARRANPDAEGESDG